MWGVVRVGWVGGGVWDGRRRGGKGGRDVEGKGCG